MDGPVGLLIVHGIGNQRVGVLSDSVALRLTDVEGINTKQTVTPPVSLSARDEQAADTLEIREIRVDDLPVMIHEANWAPLSHPDNPPQVRDCSDVVSEFYGTVSASWHSASQVSRSDPTSKSDSGQKPMFVWLVISVVLTTLLVAFLNIDRFGSQLSSLQSDYSMGVLGFALMVYMVYSLLNALRKWKSDKLDNGNKSWMSIFVHLPVAILWGFYRPIFFLMGAEILLFLSVAVFVAYPVNFMGRLLTYPFRGVGWLFSCLHLGFFSRWVHRLGWVMVVLPVHSFLQAVKAMGNLFSILFSEKGAVVRAIALFGLLWVFIAFLVLAVISEILLLLPLVPFLPDAEAGRGWFQVSPEMIIAYLVIVIPVYLVLLKVSLPAIDLILDISNYHLASKLERKQYLTRIERGVTILLEGGCKEIHVLAHSLGSVIMYDWLHSREPKSNPVTTLHTIGSPLDKFWYIDHTQARRHLDREGLGNRVSRTWLNYWAFSDPVSGKLNHFNAPGLQVTNKRLRWLGPYFWSHGWYWSNREVITEIRDRIRKASL